MRTPKEMGVLIRKLRGDMSLRDFAKKCGVSHTTIDYLEKGVDFRTGKPTYPSTVVLSKIAAAANVPLDFIMENPASNSDEDKIKVALFGGDTEVTEEMWNKVLDYVNLLKLQHQTKKK